MATIAPPLQRDAVTTRATGYVSCRLCGSARVTPRERRGTHRYMQCGACSLAFVADLPEDGALLEQYEAGASSRLTYYRLAAEADRRSFEALLTRIERYAPRGRILDLGCNIGTFVRAARDRGWAATGVDVNAAAVAYGRRADGLDLLTLEQFQASGLDGFDVIHSSDTVEHFSDPIGSMRSFISKCRPGGTVFISTPNYDSPLCKLLQMKPTEHVYLFNKASVFYLFNKLSLDIVDSFYFDRYRNLSAMFESTTFDHIAPAKAIFRALHRFKPELPLRLEGRENIVAVGRRT